MSLTKEQIKSSFRTRLKEITVSEWGGNVYLKPLTVAELIQWNGTITEHPDDLLAYQSELLVMSLVDSYGNKLFDDSEGSVVNDLSFEAVSYVLKEICEFNGLTAKASEAIGKKNTDDASTPASDGSSTTLENELDGDNGVASDRVSVLGGASEDTSPT